MANTAICTFRRFFYKVEKYTILVTEDHRYLFRAPKKIYGISFSTERKLYLYHVQYLTLYVPSRFSYQ